MLAAEDEGVSLEVIDLRCLDPLDLDTVAESVKHTGKLVVVHEASRTSGIGAEICAQITETCFDYLEHAPLRVTGFDILIHLHGSNPIICQPGQSDACRGHGHAPQRDTRRRCQVMAPNTFKLPDLGEGLTESEVLNWKIQVGEHVALNQIIAEVENGEGSR